MDVATALLGLSGSDIKSLLDETKVKADEIAKKLEYALLGIKPADGYMVKEESLTANSAHTYDLEKNFGGRIRFLRVKTDQTIYLKLNNGSDEITIAATTYYPAEYHLMINKITIRVGASDAAVKLYGEYV